MNTRDKRHVLVCWEIGGEMEILAIKNVLNNNEAVVLEKTFNVIWNGEEHPAIIKQIGTKAECNNTLKMLSQYVQNTSLTSTVNKQSASKPTETSEMQIKLLKEQLNAANSKITELESQVVELKENLKNSQSESSNKDNEIKELKDSQGILGINF